MRVLYLGYWSAIDTLTQSVIVPRLVLLSQKKEIDKIVFCTIERCGKAEFNNTAKIEWIGFESAKKRNVLLTKFSDFTQLPAFLSNIVRTKKIDLVIANSPLAGGACYLAVRNISVPFIVECFEPHAQSMRESGVWKVWDLRYLILSYLEGRQKKKAWRLQTVSNHYTQYLLKEGVCKDTIITLPNTVDAMEFAFNENDRVKVRNQLGFDREAVVGIYVGKFGGIYYDDEAFVLFKNAFNFFGKNFRLIVLTPQILSEVGHKLNSYFIEMSNVFVASVPHNQVSKYLSAADFAFATIKPTPGRIYCCPVKNGEYWANGLPILIEQGIGDDSDIIKAEGGGVIFDIRKPEAGFHQLSLLMKTGRGRLAKGISSIGHKYRGKKLMEDAYHKIINDYGKEAFT